MSNNKEYKNFLNKLQIFAGLSENKATTRHKEGLALLRELPEYEESLGNKFPQIFNELTDKIASSAPVNSKQGFLLIWENMIGSSLVSHSDITKDLAVKNLTKYNDSQVVIETLGKAGIMAVQSQPDMVRICKQLLSPKYLKDYPGEVEKALINIKNNFWEGSAMGGYGSGDTDFSHVNEVVLNALDKVTSSIKKRTPPDGSATVSSVIEAFKASKKKGLM